MITLDEIDRDFIKDLLIRCKVILKLRMIDPKICQSGRDRSREYAKMTQKAIDLLDEKSKIHS